MSVFNWVKLSYAFTHFPHHTTLSTTQPTNPLNYPHHTKQPYTLHHHHHTTTPCHFSRTTTPQQQHHHERLKQHTQQHNTHKQYNNTTTHKRTCYSHHNSPTTLTIYKTVNRLSKCPLHLKYTIIKTIQLNHFR